MFHDCRLMDEAGKVMICKSVLQDLQASVAEGQVAVAAANEWRDTVIDLISQIKSTEKEIEESEAALGEAKSAEEAAMAESKRLQEELESMKKSHVKAMREVDMKSSELTRSITEMKKKCQISTEKQTILTGTIAELEDKISKVEQANVEQMQIRRSLEEKHTDKSVYVKQLEEQCHLVELRNAELQAQVTEAEQSLSKSRDALNQQKKENEDFNREYQKRAQSFSNGLIAMKAEETEIFEAVQTLKTEMVVVQDAQVEESLKHAELANKVSRLEKEAGSMKLEVSTKKAEIESVQKEIETLNEKMAIEESIVSKQASDLVAQNELLKTMEEDCESLFRRHSVLLATNQDLEKNVNKLTDDSAIQKNRIVERKDSVRKQHEKAETLQRKIEKLTNDRDAREIEVRMKTELKDAEISNLDAEISQLKIHLAGLDDEMKEISVNLQLKQQRAIQLDEEMKDTQMNHVSYLTESNEEVEKLKLEKLAKKSELEQVLAEMNDWDKKLAELEQVQAQEILSAEENFTSRIRQKEAEIQAHTTQNKLTKDRIQALQQEIETVQKDTAEATSKFEEVMAEIASIQMELASTEEQVSSCKAKIENSEKSHAAAMSSLEDDKNQQANQKRQQIQSRQSEELEAKILTFETEIASQRALVIHLSHKWTELIDENERLGEDRITAEAKHARLVEQVLAGEKVLSKIW